ncbi:PucR family transcriptional regulator [uncultured Jatrophihabitans sp.]|uniref:PucR family transcriptional regulator n=1 Tax=uncultured Jatrophihabitans sp. TaxID=1610747 RepID=UPI0035CA29DB
MTLELTQGSAQAWMSELIESWDVDSLATKIVERDMAIAFADRSNDPRFAELLRRSASSNIDVLCRYFSGTISLESIPLSEQVEFAREQVKLGGSQNVLQRSYRIGLQTIASDWLALLAQEVTHRHLGAEEAVSAITVSVEKLLQFTDVVLTKVAYEFAEHEAQLRRTGEQVRRQIVLELVERDGPIETAELLTVLGYDVSGAHLAVEIAGITASAAHGLMSELRRAGKSSNQLVLARRIDHLMLWLYQPRAWSEEAISAVVEALTARGVLATVSRPAAGLEGLRSSYREISEMETLRAFGSPAVPQVISYADVQLDLLLLQQPDAARRFVEETLGSLADDTHVSARLRETLAASFLYASHVQAAERLGLHEHTVRNRLQRAEQILGKPVSGRRVEIQAALRLHAILQPSAV